MNSDRTQNIICPQNRNKPCIERRAGPYLHASVCTTGPAAGSCTFRAMCSNRSVRSVPDVRRQHPVRSQPQKSILPAPDRSVLYETRFSVNGHLSIFLKAALPRLSFLFEDGQIGFQGIRRNPADTRAGI